MSEMHSATISSAHQRGPGPTRRRRRRRQNWFTFPARLISVASVGALCAWLLFAFLAKALHPYLLGYAEQRKISAMRERLAAQTRQNQALQNRVAFLQTAEGAETEARHSGFHKPGEHVYLLPSDDSRDSYSGY